MIYQHDKYKNYYSKCFALPQEKRRNTDVCLQADIRMHHAVVMATKLTISKQT